MKVITMSTLDFNPPVLESTQSDHGVKDWPRRFAVVACLAFSVFCFWKALSTADTTDRQAEISAPAAVTATPVAYRREVATRPIQEVKVGHRVLARNPEITDDERHQWGPEPDFTRWMHLTLQMAKDNGGVLHIELLRPEDWVRSQLAFVVTEKSPVEQPDGSAESHETLANFKSPTTESPNGLSSRVASDVPLSPLRPLFLDLAVTAAIVDQADADLAALTVEMDLPEMGAVGTAIVTDLQPVQHVETGEGSVVTATFRHPPSSRVLDVSFADLADLQIADNVVSNSTSISPATVSAADTIGVTENHLFWSVDRQDFVPIGQMEIGEQVQTLHGETKVIASILPRPGPAEEVYNLEVYGEHCYQAGNSRLLVHNSCLPKYVYRVLSPDEIPAAGIRPKSPGTYQFDSVGDSIAYHVKYGSREWYKGQNLVSVTDSFETALSIAGGRPGIKRIVRIDLSKVGVPVHDLRQGVKHLSDLYDNVPYGTPSVYAQAWRELVIEGSVPPEAVEQFATWIGKAGG